MGLSKNIDQFRTLSITFSSVSEGKRLCCDRKMSVLNHQSEQKTKEMEELKEKAVHQKGGEEAKSMTAAEA